MKRACHRCSKPTDDATGLCPDCRASYRSPTERVYDELAWRRVSANFLRLHKWCVLCLERGLTTPATVADHYPRTRRELFAAGIDNPDAFEYLRPLCKADHSRYGRRSIMRFDNDPA